MPEQALPRILCVDDEPRVVQGLAVHLRRGYEVLTALGGEEALERLQGATPVAVIVSDMRMPGMDGATLLAKVRNLYPDTTRVLLTGEPGRDAVVAAVNKGQIFRFLTKPCPPEDILACIEAAVDQHRLVTAERVLLQETLVGAIRALIDVLALANPVAFGRASRLRQKALAFAGYLGYAKDYWQLEAAAMLSQIGYLSLPAETVEKIYYGEHLTPEERVLAQGVPEMAARLLGRIPRLEPVLQILAALTASDEEFARLGEGSTGTAARILSLVLEYDALVSQSNPPETAVQILQKRSRPYGAKLVEDFATHIGASVGEMQVMEIALRLVRPGMTILQDVRTELGTLLVARGFEVTERFTERVRNFGPGLLAEKITVSVPASRAP
ncbi:MAG TPA: HD domain-containing phosphohydrolase [Steroidobacteraceae bacterium]